MANTFKGLAELADWTTAPLAAESAAKPDPPPEDPPVPPLADTAPVLPGLGYCHDDDLGRPDAVDDLVGEARHQNPPSEPIL